MISRKMIVSLVFVCILGKWSNKYFTLCVWSNVKQKNKKNPHSKPPKSTKNGNHHHEPPHKPTVSHPATHREPPCNPPRAKPPPKLTQNPPRNPLRPTAQNQKSSSKSTKPHQFQTTGNTETHHRKHHNPKSAIIKPNDSRSGKS